MSMKSGSSPSEGSEQWWTVRVESVEPAPHGRWMLGTCSFIRVEALGGLGQCSTAKPVELPQKQWREQQ